MTVKELIYELLDYDDNAEVLMYKGKGGLEVVKKDNIEYDELTNEVILT